MIVDSHCHAWRRWPYDAAVPDPGHRGSVEALVHEMDQNDVERAAVICAMDGDIHATVPPFAAAYLERFPDGPHTSAFRAQLAAIPESAEPTRHELLAEGRELMAAQRGDGAFTFVLDGRHRSKADFVVARDACLELYRPEGGDFWETPLHAPSLLAAGHAAVAYELGYRAFGDRYRERTRHWLRALLPFTHLWEPPGLPMRYNIKPCLCSSDWYFAHWVRDDVQWEVLRVLTMAVGHGIDLAAADSEIDWRRYQAGITWAAVRWLLDHRDDTWRPHNLPGTLGRYRMGVLDTCLPDTHNSTTGLYGGMAILPDTIAVNLLDLLADDRTTPVIVGDRPRVNWNGVSSR